MTQNSQPSDMVAGDAHRKVDRDDPLRALRLEPGFTFQGKQTMEFLADWYPAEGRPCGAEAILEALRGFLPAVGRAGADARGATPVDDWRRDSSALRLASSSAVAVALGLELRSARLRTPVQGQRGTAYPLVRPLRSGGSYDFRPAGAAGMSARGVEWRQALAFRASNYGPYVERGELHMAEMDFDSTFGFALKPESLRSEWQRFDHVRSAAECDLWWLLGILKPAVIILKDKLLRGARVTTRGVSAVVQKVAGNSGLRAIEERTWRSRIAFGLPLAAVNHTLAELGIDSQPRQRPVVRSIGSWPMMANRHAN